MEVLLAIVVGVLYATGEYMILRRSIFKLILGLGLLGHAANL
ncbi:MAG: NADH-quinone oxidoreductase subunit K, partial [Anaerolineae bacterium]|nr:NADH-quinone oxidoreductase subunit K [Anaerolineae bacterium]